MENITTTYRVAAQPLPQTFRELMLRPRERSFMLGRTQRLDCVILATLFQCEAVEHCFSQRTEARTMRALRIKVPILVSQILTNANHARCKSRDSSVGKYSQTHCVSNSLTS